MTSKFCPTCKQIISCNLTPNYCPNGCGSLKNQPILRQFFSLKERQEIINEQLEKITVITDKNGQIKLF